MEIEKRNGRSSTVKCVKLDAYQHIHCGHS
jgi:hypothetical protein